MGDRMTNNPEVTAVDNEMKTVDNLGRIAQMQALKGDAVDIKVAALERSLRADKKVWADKLKRAKERVHIAMKATEKEGRRASRGLIEGHLEEAVETFNKCGLTRWDGQGYTMEELFPTTGLEWSLDEVGDVLTIRQRTTISIDRDSQQHLEWTFEDCSTLGDTCSLFVLYKDLQEKQRQVTEYTELLEEVKRKLNDTDYVERQVKAEISKAMFRDIDGGDTLLTVIADMDPFEEGTSRLLLEAPSASSTGEIEDDKEE